MSFFQIFAIVWEFISSHPEISVPSAGFLFELIFRRVPTQRDYSLINIFKRIVDIIIPNVNKGKATPPTNKNENNGVPPLS
jgi:hypothetical protein